MVDHNLPRSQIIQPVILYLARFILYLYPILFCDPTHRCWTIIFLETLLVPARNCEISKKATGTGEDNNNRRVL